MTQEEGAPGPGRARAPYLPLLSSWQEPHGGPGLSALMDEELQEGPVLRSTITVLPGPRSSSERSLTPQGEAASQVRLQVSVTLTQVPPPTHTCGTTSFLFKAPLSQRTKQVRSGFFFVNETMEAVNIAVPMRR